MKLSNWMTVILAAWCVAWGIVGCRRIIPKQSGSTDTTDILTISAAASLEDALEAINPLLERTHPTIQVNYNFAASGALQRQIEQGAPIDVFFSAAAKQMDRLQEKNLIRPETRRNLVANQLVVITSENSILDLTRLDQLKTDRVRKIAVGEFRSVPAGQYAKEAFETFGLLEALQAKFVFGANVRGVLAAVESGNVDAGVVYTTDVLLSDSVKVVAVVSAESHSAIVYPVAVLAASSRVDEAIAYIDFLSSRQARVIFNEFGFATP
ncbi:MAG: molybdate ABC transporter substrate-binding protein [Leptolyngbyaceae cyanobacterium MO_188.B28]|nr:molybdate ABC transporter substrate-binding protein [Leptolyngbyaceae cyanobacterium MO_188.B28]